MIDSFFVFHAWFHASSWRQCLKPGKQAIIHGTRILVATTELQSPQNFELKNIVAAASDGGNTVYPCAVCKKCNLCIDVWATDHTYLSSFWSWVSGRTFFPREGKGVTVVETEQVISPPATKCHQCQARWDNSRMKDLMVAANWDDLDQLVSCIYCKAFWQAEWAYPLWSSPLH